MAHSHPYMQHGDPAAPGHLRAAVDRLGRTLASDDEEGARAVVLAEERTVRGWLRDLDPRTRSQVRGLLLAFDLVRAGDLDQALALVDGELRRSFPGEAELPPSPQA